MRMRKPTVSIECLKNKRSLLLILMNQSAKRLKIRLHLKNYQKYLKLIFSIKMTNKKEKAQFGEMLNKQRRFNSKENALRVSFRKNLRIRKMLLLTLNMTCLTQQFQSNSIWITTLKKRKSLKLRKVSQLKPRENLRCQELNLQSKLSV